MCSAEGGFKGRGGKKVKGNGGHPCDKLVVWKARRRRGTMGQGEGAGRREAVWYIASDDRILLRPTWRGRGLMTLKKGGKRKGISLVEDQDEYEIRELR